jgi:hypothetical protein
MKIGQYVVLVTVVFSIIGYEMYLGSPAWSETGTINWVGTKLTFNFKASTQYFVQPYSAVVSRGTFNFTAYIVSGNLPIVGGSVTVICDHYGLVYVR